MDDKALFTILRCAEQTDGQVGRSGLLKILQGRDSRKLSKLKLDHLEESEPPELRPHAGADRRGGGRGALRSDAERWQLLMLVG